MAKHHGDASVSVCVCVCVCVFSLKGLHSYSYRALTSLREVRLATNALLSSSRNGSGYSPSGLAGLLELWIELTIEWVWIKGRDILQRIQTLWKSFGVRLIYPGRHEVDYLIPCR